MTGCLFFFSSRRRHTRLQGDWSSDVCSSDLDPFLAAAPASRLPFVIRTPDRRFPAGNDRPAQQAVVVPGNFTTVDRKSTRLNSSHLVISYAVFCLKKKKNKSTHKTDNRHGQT